MVLPASARLMTSSTSPQKRRESPGRDAGKVQQDDTDFNQADPKLLDAVAAFMQSRAEDGADALDDPATVFDAASPPEVTVREYLSRLVQYADCSQECYVMAAIYAERVRMVITPANVHRLYLAGLVLAVKYRDDFYFSNDFYSLVGGVSLTEVNRLEIEILRRINWRAHVSEQQYERELRRYTLALEKAQLMSMTPNSERDSLQSAASRGGWTHYDDALSLTTSERSTPAESDADSFYDQQSPEKCRRSRGEKVQPQPCWRRIVSWLHRNGFH